MQLDKLVAGNISEGNSKCNLAATISHHGPTATSGHYDCCVVNNKNEAVKCNNAKLIQGSSNRSVKSERLQKSARLLFCVANNGTASSENNLPYRFNEVLQEVVCCIEKCLSGLQSIKSSLLCNEDLKRLAGKEKLNGDVIYCFMCRIAHMEIHQERRVYVLSNYLLTDLIGKKKKSYVLNEVIRSCSEILRSEIIIISYHQGSWDHWSFIIHCDSVPNAAADNDLMHSMSLLLGKLTK